MKRRGIDNMDEEPRPPVEIRASLREALERMNDYSKGLKKARPGSQELAFHIQHMQQELDRSMRYHIRGINMNPPTPVVPLLD